MSVNSEFQQIISDIDSVLVNSNNQRPQQVATNIVNCLTPKHYDTISKIYEKYPELADLDGAAVDIEILSDAEIWPSALDDIKDTFKQIKKKYNY